MMSPTPILDVFAAVMLVTAAVSGTQLAAARLPAGRRLAGWQSEVVPAGSRSRPRGSAGLDHDITHLLMGVAMAGMLAPGLATLTPGAWEAIFGALTGWFAWRAARDARVAGIRALVSGHSAVHLMQCAAMVYLFAAVTTSSGMPMTGMGAASPSLEFPALALAFASVLAACTAGDIGQLAVRRYRRALAPSAGAAVTSRIVMGVTIRDTGRRPRARGHGALPLVPRDRSG
jgi:hypothetical protein